MMLLESIYDEEIGYEYRHLLGKRLGDYDVCYSMGAAMDLAGRSWSVGTAVAATEASSKEGISTCSSVI